MPKDGACHKFYESPIEEFKRIGRYFDPEEKTCKLDPTKAFSTTEALKWYGISMQGLHGDNHAPKPSIFNIIETMKWNAYEKVKGMDRAEARKEFVEHASKALIEHGFKPEHPQKDKINAAYMKCVADKLASGESKEEIEAESHKAEAAEARKKEAKLEA